MGVCVHALSLLAKHSARCGVTSRGAESDVYECLFTCVAFPSHSRLHCRRPIVDPRPSYSVPPNRRLTTAIDIPRQRRSIWPTGFLCGWSAGVEFAAALPDRSGI